MRRAGSPAASKLLRMVSSRSLGFGKQVQRRQRQAQAYRAVELVIAIVRHSEVTVANGDHVPVVSYGIRSLRDFSRKDDRAVDPGTRIVERSNIVAKIGGYGPDGHVSAKCCRRAVVAPDLDTGTGWADIQVEGVLRPYEAGHEG